MNSSKIHIRYALGKKRYYVASANKETYLTNKEAGIISCLVKGLRPKEIAWELTISLNTVNTHLANIKIKLGCLSIFQLGLVLGNLIAVDDSIFQAKDLDQDTV